VAALYPAVYRRFHVSHRVVPGTDITPRMLSVLQHLVQSGPLTIGEQAQHLGLSKAATTEMIDRLEARGLVARLRDERDRRRVFVWLTTAGRERAGAHPRVLEDEQLVRALARMTPRERTGLVIGLRALIRAGEETKHDHDPM
jgi:DNA-binding MarR family transcriptional regulator